MNLIIKKIIGRLIDKEILLVAAPDEFDFDTSHLSRSGTIRPEFPLVYKYDKESTVVVAPL